MDINPVQETLVIEMSPCIEELIGEITTTSSLLMLLHRAAESSEVLVGQMFEASGVWEWSVIPPGPNDTVTWKNIARQFFKEADPTECVRVAIFLPYLPCILFSMDRSDVPSLKFPERSPVVQIRLTKAVQKRQRRAQRNRRTLANISSNG